MAADRVARVLDEEQPASRPLHAPRLPQPEILLRDRAEHERGPRGVEGSPPARGGTSAISRRVGEPSGSLRRRARSSIAVATPIAVTRERGRWNPRFLPVPTPILSTPAPCRRGSRRETSAASRARRVSRRPSGVTDTRHQHNAYTNIVAVWVLCRALECSSCSPTRVAEETARWGDISRRMFVPFHDGGISQFEGYDRLRELDLAGYRARYGNIQRLDLILEAENNRANHDKLAKQADVLMPFYQFFPRSSAICSNVLAIRSSTRPFRETSSTTPAACPAAPRCAAWCAPG
jgi:hypothetical protein